MKINLTFLGREMNIFLKFGLWLKKVKNECFNEPLFVPQALRQPHVHSRCAEKSKAIQSFIYHYFEIYRLDMSCPYHRESQYGLIRFREIKTLAYCNCTFIY